MAVDIDLRGSWGGQGTIFLIGPGAVGKSTVGALLATRLGRCFVDLDHELSRQIGDIGAFIRQGGYAHYAAANSELAETLVRNAAAPLVFAASSGFLAQDYPPDARDMNRRLIESGYSVSLLPAADIETATSIVVRRQAGRSFFRGAEREARAFRDRFALYRASGDMLVISSAAPARIADAIAMRLHG